MGLLLEGLVVLGMLQRDNDRLGGQSMANRILRGKLPAVSVLGPVLPSALRRLASICLTEVMLEARSLNWLRSVIGGAAGVVELAWTPPM